MTHSVLDGLLCGGMVGNESLFRKDRLSEVILNTSYMDTCLCTEPNTENNIIDVTVPK